MNKVLLSLTKSLGLIFIIVVLLPLPFFMLNYERELISLFSISLLLVWTDGFLTYYAVVRLGATELNPLVRGLSKIMSWKKSILLSRLVGSLFSYYGLIEKNQPFLVVLSWIFSIVICFNSISLSLRSFKNVEYHDADNSNDY